MTILRFSSLSPRMNRKHTLTDRELRMLIRLADGDTYKELQEYFGVSAPNVHTTCAIIRAKTGIRQTRDPEECKHYLASIQAQRIADVQAPPDRNGFRPRNVTHCQLEVFRLLVRGRTYEEISKLLGVTSQSVQNLASRGCKRAGIHHQGWNRTAAIREYLTSFHPSRPADEPDPMDDPAF